MVIVNPGIHVSTAEAYAGVTPRKPAQPLEELIRLPVNEWKNQIINDFEPVMISKVSGNWRNQGQVV